MTGLRNALKGEMRKLARRKKYNVLFILFMIAYLIGRAIASFTHVSGASDVAMGNGLIVIYLPLIAFMAANDLIASEIRDRSIQQCLVKPVTRMEVYFAKCLAAFIKCVRHAFWLILIDCVLMIFDMNAGSHLQVVYMLFDLIPLMTLVAFSALIAVVVRNPALSMLLTLVVYAGLHVAGSFLGVSPILFTSYLGWHGMLHGGLSAVGFIERFLAVTAPGIMFTALGAIVLERKRF
ncbi:MAG: ABC transporter permease subunit [Clostridia bacterium]|nr:ABC transporter permease subunit [Clostridia bacterium]